MSSATDRERLDDITDALQNGATETIVDGETLKLNLEHLRREKVQLEIKLGIRRRRPRAFGLLTGDR